MTATFDSFDCELGDAPIARRLIFGLIVPRPIAWVSTRSAAGLDNLAPFSFFNAVSADPPILMFAISRLGSGPAQKDTLANIIATETFVVNLASPSSQPELALTAKRVEAGTDEFELANVPKVEATKVAVARVANARAGLECRLHRLDEVGDATVVFGRVAMTHVVKGLTVDGYINTGELDPISRVAGDGYAAVQPITNAGKS